MHLTWCRLVGRTNAKECFSAFKFELSIKWTIVPGELKWRRPTLRIGLEVLFPLFQRKIFRHKSWLIRRRTRPSPELLLVRMKSHQNWSNYVKTPSLKHIKNLPSISEIWPSRSCFSVWSDESSMIDSFRVCGNFRVNVELNISIWRFKGRNSTDKNVFKLQNLWKAILHEK